MASIGIGFLGEPAVAKLIEPIFGGLSHGVAVAISVAIAYALVTSLHVTVGEQAPKLFAIARPEDSARRLAAPCTGSAGSRAPFTVALTWLSNGVVAPLRRPAGRARRGAADLRGPAGADLAVGGARQARPGRGRDAGRRLPPPRAGGARGDDPDPGGGHRRCSANVSDALNLCISSGHNRLVVVEDGNADRVRGIVHALRLVRLMMAEGPEAKIEPAIRDALIVPETKPLDDLLTELQRQRSSMGVVVDEYGRTVGIVTVEDILEEVVGEIEDETDPLAGSLRQLANGDWYVRGHVSLGDLADRGIELPVDTDAYNSVGGYVFGELGRLPKRGDLITADGYEIRVESVRENRIEAVRIHPPVRVGPSVAGVFPSVRLRL